MTLMRSERPVSWGPRATGGGQTPRAPDLPSTVPPLAEGPVSLSETRNRPCASSHESRADVADPRRRRSISRRIVPALCLVVVLSGCAGSRTPTSYTGSVRTAFVAGCQEAGQTGGVCGCVFRQLMMKVPFNDFKRLNGQLANRPGRLPTKLTQMIEPCKARKR